MRISDWSSDVCSSDLPDCLVGRSWQTGVASRPPHPPARLPAASTRAAGAALAQTVRGTDRSVQDGGPASRLAAASGSPATHAAWPPRQARNPCLEIGSKSVRERVGPYV